MLAGRTSPSAARPVLPMADIQLVETSLRDGNQCLWAALGIDTARTLSIAPVMDRVGFRAIDFTTSTHMGVAVRYKKEDPWERIRLMAAATPNTPLQFMSTGFRFISGNRQPRFHGAGIPDILARNGIRRLPRGSRTMQNRRHGLRRMVKQGGGDFVIVALVFTLSPMMTPTTSSGRQLAACPFVDALYIRIRAAAQPARAKPSPAITAVIAKPLGAFSLHNRARRTRPWTHPILACRRCNRFRAAGGTRIRIPRAWRNLRALGHRVAVDEEALGRVSQYFTQLAEAEGLPVGAPQASMPASGSISCPAAWSAPRAASSPRRGVASRGSRNRGVGPGREELGWPIVMTPFAQIL